MARKSKSRFKSSLHQVSVHDIDMAVTNFPLISQVEGSRGTTLFALDVLRTPRYLVINISDEFEKVGLGAFPLPDIYIRRGLTLKRCDL